MNVSWDDRDGEHESAADWDGIRGLIGSLDGRERTHVSLGIPRLTWSAEDPRGTAWSCTSVSAGRSTSWSPRGLGNPTRRSSSWLRASPVSTRPGSWSSGQPALDAARTFVEVGALEPSLDWAEQV